MVDINIRYFPILFKDGKIKGKSKNVYKDGVKSVEMELTFPKKHWTVVKDNNSNLTLKLKAEQLQSPRVSVHPPKKKKKPVTKKE